MVTDITLGGLVLGCRHSENGIKVIQFNGESFNLMFEIEGGEFVVNTYAEKEYHNRIIEINSYLNPDETDIQEEDLEDIPVFVIPKGHFALLRSKKLCVVNRSATKRFLRELTEINESTTHMFPPEEQK